MKDAAPGGAWPRSKQVRGFGQRRPLGLIGKPFLEVFDVALHVGQTVLQGDRGIACRHGSDPPRARRAIASRPAPPPPWRRNGFAGSERRSRSAWRRARHSRSARRCATRSRRRASPERRGTPSGSGAPPRPAPRAAPVTSDPVPASRSRHRCAVRSVPAERPKDNAARPRD